MEARLPDGAYYLAGYAVECALKACIAKETGRHDFRDKERVNASYSHKLQDLMRVANLESARLEEADRDPVFRKHWDIVRQWSESSRYERPGPEMAQLLVGAIDDRKHGLIAWIRQHW